jgi:hypothetical protein
MTHVYSENCDHCEEVLDPKQMVTYLRVPFRVKHAEEGEDAYLCRDCDNFLKESDPYYDPSLLDWKRKSRMLQALRDHALTGTEQSLMAHHIEALERRIDRMTEIHKAERQASHQTIDSLKKQLREMEEEFLGE